MTLHLQFTCVFPFLRSLMDGLDVMPQIGWIGELLTTNSASGFNLLMDGLDVTPQSVWIGKLLTTNFASGFNPLMDGLDVTSQRVLKSLVTCSLF